MVCEDEGIQNPVYNVSKSLINAQMRYTRTEKLIFTLFVTTRKLKHYFQFLPIVVLTEYPLSHVENPEATGRIAKWVTEIKPLVVAFEPRTVIKGQILADFIAEFTPGPPPQSNLFRGWILNMDEASNGRGVGVGIVSQRDSNLEILLEFRAPTMRPSTKQSSRI